MDLDFYDLLEAVHRKMERGEKYYTLLSDKPKWNQLCTSLYTIEDAQCAIDAYVSYDFPTDINGGYLYIYGLLQALYLQQDAANGLSKSLLNKSIKFQKDYPALYRVREIRNDATGHPTGRNRKNGCKQSYVQISQVSMSKQGFSYAIYKDTNDFKFEEEKVSLCKCIKEQNESILKILKEICALLDDEWRAYLERFRGKEMLKIFDGLTHVKANALEGGIFAASSISSAKNIVERCKNALNERYGDWKYIDSFKFEIEEIEEIFTLLDSKYGESNTRINHYLTELLFVKLERLEKYAKEIDEEFQIDKEE